MIFFEFLNLKTLVKRGFFLNGGLFFDCRGDLADGTAEGLYNSDGKQEGREGESVLGEDAIKLQCREQCNFPWAGIHKRNWQQGKEKDGGTQPDDNANRYINICGPGGHCIGSDADNSANCAHCKDFEMEGGTDCAEQTKLSEEFYQAFCKPVGQSGGKRVEYEPFDFFLEDGTEKKDGENDQSNK